MHEQLTRVLGLEGFAVMAVEEKWDELDLELVAILGLLEPRHPPVLRPARPPYHRGVRIRVDTTRRLAEQPKIGHNRWHPDIPAVASVAPGEELTLELLDGLDGQFTPASRHENLLQTEPLGALPHRPHRGRGR